MHKRFTWHVVLFTGLGNKKWRQRGCAQRVTTAHTTVSYCLFDSGEFPKMDKRLEYSGASRGVPTSDAGGL